MFANFKAMRYFHYLLVLICFSCSDSVVEDADDHFEDVITTKTDTSSNVGESVTIVPDTPLTNILIDASHGGGAWWYPQGVNCNPESYHQGRGFANELSAHKYSVYESCREEVIDPKQFKELALLVVADGYRAFSKSEADRVLEYLSDGGNVLLMLDHGAPLNNRETWSALGLEFYKTNVNDVIINFETHKVAYGMPATLATRGVSAISSDGKGIDVIARLSSDTYLDLNFNGTLDANDRVNPIFMGAIEYGKGKLVFCGDVNLWQRDMTLIRNTMSWFGMD